MCATCGCGDESATRVTTLPSVTAGPGHHHPEADHEHPHGHRHAADHEHPHSHPPGEPQSGAPTETLVMEQEILAKNDLLAARNRGWLTGRGITAVNVMSAPGSGKTTLLARTISELAGSDAASGRVAVIEGDQETLLDAERIRATGAPVSQINTGAGCHLDADMVRRGLDSLSPRPGTLLFIENVGNLVCPALFDLGEAARVVVISVTEGQDKPLKYPHMFSAADLVVINKSDLLPYVDFDVEACIGYVQQIRPGVPCLVVSATTGEGLDEWYGWLRSQEVPD